MKAIDFARAVADERNALLADYFAELPASSAGREIAQLGLTGKQREILQSIMKQALTDLAYTLLLGLDGEARIGHLMQQSFRLLDEGGELLTGGDLEGAAWDVFYGNE